MAWVAYSCFLAVIFFHLAACVVDIQTDPSEIQVGLTDWLNVRCLYLSESPMETVLSLILSRDINGTGDRLELASLSGYTGQAVSQVPQMDIEAVGDLQAAGGPYLSVTFRQFRDIKTGVYRCQVNGVDNNGHIFAKENWARILGTYPDYDTLVNVIRNLRNKTAEAASLATTINKINDGINSSFSASTIANQQMLHALTELLTNTTLVAGKARQDAQSLISELQNAAKDAERKADALQLGFSGEMSHLSSETSSLTQKTNAFDSSFTVWKSDLHRTVSELQAADRAINATLNRIMRDLEDFDRRLTSVETFDSIFHERVTGIQSVLFKWPWRYQDREFLLSFHSFRDQSVAEATCALYDGYLAEINDAETFQAVIEYMNNGTGPAGVVVSGTDEVTEGHWVFQHSQTSAFFNAWGTSQPTPDTAQNCRYMIKSQNWKMVVTLCNDNVSKFRFLCEVPL